ncbi:myb-like protein D [Octopus sinensis]|uniref:Myb-like protein D n=1 Tax=Octopus sinensis TaxID=2607531 RepID=A0A6P7U1U3_9MOLL|nr:myb-like protein D [Octopus sinensis]
MSNPNRNNTNMNNAKAYTQTTNNNKNNRNTNTDKQILNKINNINITNNTNNYANKSQNNSTYKNNSINLYSGINKPKDTQPINMNLYGPLPFTGPTNLMRGKVDGLLKLETYLECLEESGPAKPSHGVFKSRAIKLSNGLNL